MEQNLSYFAGRDGFIWWVGVVEDRGDPMALGRVRVRVFGYHTEDKTKLPTGDLPWAFCIQPANSASSGGIGTSPTGPIEGSWVIGFWRDPDFMQEPMIFGTLPGKITASAAPQGGAPFDYSDDQQKPASEVQTTSFIADGRTTEFSTPIATTDSTVLVTRDGESDIPENRPAESPINTEAQAPEFSGGRTYTADDFGRSRYGERTASKLNSLVPWLRDRWANGIIKFLADNPDYDASIGYGYRSMAEQRKLYNDYATGATTNRAARPGSSWHNYGCAIDLQIFLPDGRYDTGTRGDNYTTLAASAMNPFKLKNDIPNDVGHFYPSEFTKGPPTSLKNGSQTIKEYAEEKGINTEVS
tara:strand:- start:5419 stop:6489 length:1071 start_codon:yes stop_codon:yes gene_type:complete